MKTMRTDFESTRIAGCRGVLGNVTCAWQNKSSAWGWLIWPKIVSCSETFAHQEVDRKNGNQFPSIEDNGMPTECEFPIALSRPYALKFQSFSTGELSGCEFRLQWPAATATQRCGPRTPQGTKLREKRKGITEYIPPSWSQTDYCLSIEYCLSFLDLMEPMVLLGMFQCMSRDVKSVLFLLRSLYHFTSFVLILVILTILSWNYSSWLHCFLRHASWRDRWSS